MKQKILSMLLCVAMVTSLAGCGKDEETLEPVEKSEPVTLVYAEMNPLDTIAGETAVAFKEKIEEISGGNITIDIQHSGVMGDETTVVEAMMKGGSTMDMARISSTALTSHGGEKSKLLSLPFTFTSHEHFWNFASSDLADEILGEPSKNGSGIRGLFYGEEGFRHFFTNQEITGIEDFMGMKIRVSNDPIMNGLVQGLGAIPMVVSFNELYIALQNELVDAAEQPLINYKSNAFQEVASTVILDGHTLGTMQVIITDEAWNNLSTQQKQWLEEAGDYASSYNRQIAEAAEKKALEELKAEGVTIIEVDDITPWKEACNSVIENNIAGNESLYQQIQDMK
ncbi:MAG: TRAP transporter substrate-binding protein [Lachnospiraceae bacterium]|nr:TRAP transporter substrate-binding protein [Lachnospiraceae bacterium]